MKLKLILVTFLFIGIVSNFAKAQDFGLQEAYYKHKPIVEMTLNGKKVWVLLDTGAGINILNIKDQKKYAFKAILRNESTSIAQGFGSSNNRMHQVTNAALSFGDTRLWGMFFAFDISNVTKSIQERTGKTITAIIGTDTMRKYGFVIDMAYEKVTMYGDKKARKRRAQEGPTMLVSNMED